VGFKSFLYKIILKSAISFEEESHDMYKNAAQNAGSAESRDLLLSLAEAELRHKEKLAELLHSSADVAFQTEHEEESEQLELPKLDRSVLGSQSSKEILEYALQREVYSMGFYLTLAKRTPLPAARETFRYLASEEKAHKEQLEKEMQRLSEQGGA
jgi:rubrerythrin